MNLVVISYPLPLLVEFEVLTKLFEEGLEVFHLRKPKYSRDEMEHFVKRIPPEFRKKVTIHGHKSLAEEYELGGLHLGANDDFGDWKGRKSRSFHSVKEISDNNEGLDYCFISPVFDSISKKNYKSAFDLAELTINVKKTGISVYALGGIDEKSIKNLKKGDFNGVAVLGSLWHTVRVKNLLKKFRNLQEYCNNN